MRGPLPRAVRFLWFVASVPLLLSGCATSYHREAFFGDGYSETKLSADRWLVTFAASSFTPRERIDTYLLFRCAELTVENNSHYFALLSAASGDSHPRPTTPTLIDHPAWSSNALEAPRESFLPDRRHAARTIIQIFRGPKPRGYQRVYEAREVIRQLAPRMRAA